MTALHVLALICGGSQVVLIPLIIKACYLSGEQHRAAMGFANVCHRALLVGVLISIPVFAVYYWATGLGWGTLGYGVYLLIAFGHMRRLRVDHRNGDPLSAATANYLSWLLFPSFVWVVPVLLGLT